MTTETRFDELKRYVRWSDADAARLAAFRPVAEPHFERIAREFYERTREHDGAHAVFTGEAQITRLQRSMVAWLGRLLSGTYDQAYFEQTRVIGRVHVKVGLPQRYMFTAMALIRTSLEAIADDHLGAEARPTRSALTRMLDIELAIMIDGYREHLEERAQRRSALDTHGQDFEARLARRYEAATNATPHLVIGLDANGHICLFNREAQRVTGFAPEEAIGTRFVDALVPPDLRTKDEAVVGELLKSPPVTRVHDTLLTTRSGRVKDVRWTFARLEPDSHDVALFAIGADVTEERAAAERLHQQEKLAALGTLAAGLAHEIRNPLNGAQLHVAFVERAIRKRGSDPEMLEAIQVVEDEIKRLARLVSEFLDFARPRPLDLRPVDVKKLAARARELVLSQAAAASVKIELDFPGQDLVLLADPQRLEQVLLNVLHNSIEALGAQAGGNVVVRGRRLPRHVVLEVEDDGPGFPADAPVFDAFFSTKPSGTGLGLAISHRIITDHGGTIDVESRRGHTCFRFTLPMRHGMTAGTPETTDE